MDTSFLIGLKNWFDLQVQGAKNAFWLLKADGRKVNNQIKESDAGKSWRILEEMIIEQAKMGKREFTVQFKSSITDGSGMEWALEVPYNFKNYAQSGAIAGLPAATQPVQMNNDLVWQERLNRMEDKWENRFRLAEKEREINELHSVIAGVQEAQKDNFDRIADRFERALEILNPHLGPVLAGLFPQVSVSGGGGKIKPPAAPAQIGTAEPIDADEENTDDNIGAVSAEDADEVQSTGVDFNPAIQAHLELTQAGFQNPGDIILTAARKLIKNPDLINYLS